MTGKYVQVTFFDNEDLIAPKIIKKIPKRVGAKKQKKITIVAAIPLALERLPKIFPAYENPFEKSLVSEVRDICKRDFLPDNSIMREFRKQKVAEVYDHSKGIYEKI